MWGVLGGIKGEKGAKKGPQRHQNIQKGNQKDAKMDAESDPKSKSLEKDGQAPQAADQKWFGSIGGAHLESQEGEQGARRRPTCAMFCVILELIFCIFSYRSFESVFLVDLGIGVGTNNARKFIIFS